MNKTILRLLSLLLSLGLLLSGCMMPLDELMAEINALRQDLQTPDRGNPLDPEEYTHYDDMAYTRPDVSVVRESYDAACELAKGEDAEAIMEAVYAFYDEYDWFYTLYSLADLRYNSDLTDKEWETEYNFCVDNSPAVDAMLEELYYVLAKSPARKALEGKQYFGPGFFDSYDGENNWDEAFTALLEQEAALENEYYALFGEAQELTTVGSAEFYDGYAESLAQILAELIALRQKMAAHYGYTEYDQFAWDFYYYRDYTPAQMEGYLEDICRELVPLYVGLSGSIWDAAYEPCSEEEMFAYLRQTAVDMGGIVEESFYLLDAAGLHDLSYGPNKFNSSFEVYLTSYDEPFIFLNATQTAYDCLTLAHEFGHFCNDYASWGSYAGIDVLEVFSQGMEYMSLCYAEDDRGLTQVKMADSLCTYVEQAGYAWFEHEAYKLTGEDLTPENLFKLYEEMMERFGFDTMYWVDRRDFVTITHYYTNPMYIDSYVVSNDAAMQLYQMELETPGAGLQRLQDELDTEESYFLEFLEAAELESPFAPGRLEQVKKTFQALLP